MGYKSNIDTQKLGAIYQEFYSKSGNTRNRASAPEQLHYASIINLLFSYYMVDIPRLADIQQLFSQ